MNWDEYFMRMAYLVASKSKDQSTKIGAVTILDRQILSTGYNGICRGVLDDIQKRNISPEKYFWFEHAERNACFSAAREGIRLKGSIMFTQAMPCADCARAIIQSGIEQVYLHGPWDEAASDIFGDTWGESQTISKTMLEEAGVSVFSIQDKLNVETLIRGKIYKV